MTHMFGDVVVQSDLEDADEPCDCSLRAENGFFKVHAVGDPGCEANEPEPAAWTEELWLDGFLSGSGAGYY